MNRTQWAGKTVAFLGDSITDAIHLGTSKNYWQYLADWLEIRPLVYGIRGQRWRHILPQAKKLKAEHGKNVDAIFILMGSNDFNHSTPLGKWWDETTETVNHDGVFAQHLRRLPCKDETTLRGQINIALEFCRHEFTRQQIVLMTLLHRGFGTFNPKNVQPDESYANEAGLFPEDYSQVIREAGRNWAMPVLELGQLSGLYPLEPRHGIFFHNTNTDRLHPNATGHARIAATLMYQMLALPSSFR